MSSGAKIMGCSQAERHGTLTPAFAGSIPTACELRKSGRDPGRAQGSTPCYELFAEISLIGKAADLKVCSRSDCEHNPEDCVFSINCTTIEDSIQGKESYVCGFEPCIYAKRRK